MSYQELLARACELRDLIADSYKQLEDCENSNSAISASYWAGICADIDSLEQELEDVEQEIYRMVGC